MTSWIDVATDQTWRLVGTEIFWREINSACYHSLRNPRIAKSAAKSALFIANFFGHPDLTVHALNLMAVL